MLKNTEVDLEKLVLMKETNSQSPNSDSVHPFLHKTSSVQDLKATIVLTTWEIAKISMIMAPLWLVTEVRNLVAPVMDQNGVKDFFKVFSLGNLLVTC